MSTGQFVVWNVSSMYAPVYWGCIVSTALVGTTLVQGYTYFSRNPDSCIQKSLIFLILCLDTAESVLMSYTIYYLFLMNFGNMEVFLVTIPMSWIAENLVTAVVTFSVQVFLASRIYLVTSEYIVFHSWRKIMPILIFITAFASLVSAVVLNISVAKNPVLTQASMTLFELTRCFEEGLGALSDLLATCTLCIVLASGNPQKRRSPFRRLFYFILSRGILVTVVQIATLVVYIAATLHFYWMPFHLCKSKLYTSTLLLMLNSRGEASTELPTIQFRPTLQLPEIASVRSTSRPLSTGMMMPGSVFD
ncbi:hypothetical protein F5I97DRAFT_623432 [Phlebopus sp. FC_14]|nr:hypothetical protein F5I97DRAFT_623432 [Phlebopus sp. FC_14]